MQRNIASPLKNDPVERIFRFLIAISVGFGMGLTRLISANYSWDTLRFAAATGLITGAIMFTLVGLLLGYRYIRELRKDQNI